MSVLQSYIFLNWFVPRDEQRAKLTIHWESVLFKKICSTIQFYLVSNSWIFGPTQQCHALRHLCAEHLSSPFYTLLSVDLKHRRILHTLFYLTNQFTKRAYTCFWSIAIQFVLFPTWKNSWQTDFTFTKPPILRQFKLEHIHTTSQSTKESLIIIKFLPF